MTNQQAIKVLNKLNSPYSHDDIKEAVKVAKLALAKAIGAEPDNNKCYECGWTLSDDDNYCTNCGLKIKWEEEQ